jgi:hypothetical protein
MNQFDDDLRRRLDSLAIAASNAAPDLSLRPAESRGRAVRTRTALPIGALSIALVLVLVALYPRLISPGSVRHDLIPSATSQQASSPSVVGPSASSEPSGGLTYEQAVEIANPGLSPACTRSRQAPTPSRRTASSGW